MTCGLLYVATGHDRFLAEAEVSARSAKRAMPEVPITLVTDLEPRGPFDETRAIQSGSSGFRAKIQAICDPPYERTLFLDTDTYVVRDPRELFALLDHFDVAVAHDTNRISVPVGGLPDSYPEFNTGVIAYTREAMGRLGKTWLDLYDAHTQSDHGAFDQPWFRQALYDSDLRVATLPPEFNCRFQHAGFYNIPVAILHAHASEEHFEKAAKVMTDLHPEFWSQYVHFDWQIWGPHGSARKLLDLRHPLRRYRAYRALLKLLPSRLRGRFT
jgi:hypothetical protein